MEPSIIEELKQIILAEIEELQNDIEYLEEASKPVAPDCSIGRVTRMDAIGSRGVNEALLENSKNKLSYLEKNLRKANNGTIGLCSKCSEPIPLNRLKAIPETQKCVKCSQR